MSCGGHGDWQCQEELQRWGRQRDVMLPTGPFLLPLSERLVWFLFSWDTLMFYKEHDLKLTFLSALPKCWDYRYALPHPIWR